MRRFYASAGTGLLISALAVLAYAQTSGQTFLSQYATKLNKADTLSVKYTTQSVSSAPREYSIDFKKPNLARFDTPTNTIVCDGKNITTYVKSEKAYFVVPQTDKELKDLLNADEMSLWSPFFDSKAMNPAPASRDLGAANSNAVAYEKVEIPVGSRQADIYISKTDTLVHKAEIKGKTDNDPLRILSTSSISLGSEVKPETFAFNAPEGSKQVTLEELSAAKWLTDLEEAKLVASNTGKKIFVDFMASWCGPCKMLDAEVFETPNFKNYSDRLVFVKIDVDNQPTVSTAYGIEAMPTQMVLDKNGGVISKIVGYGGPEMFYDYLNKALAM